MSKNSHLNSSGGQLNHLTAFLKQEWLKAIDDAMDAKVCSESRVDVLARIDFIYQNNTEATNGYAALAWCLRNSGSDPASLWQLARKDNDAGRLTQKYMLSAALLALRANDTDEAFQFVLREIAGFYNGDIAIAKTALGYLGQQIEHDHINGIIKFETPVDRDSSTWLISLAQACAEINQTFEQIPPLIEKVYRLTPERKNALARCAWIHFRPKAQPDALIKYMEMDNTAGRLTPQWQINLASTYAENGEIEKAWPLVDKAYRSDMKLKDGYARCAWVHFWAEQKLEDLIIYMEMDNSAKRISPIQQINLAKAYAASGKLEKAIKLVTDAYEADPALKDGFSEIAKWYHKPRKEYSTLIELCRKDFALERLSKKGAYILADGLMLCGNFNAAICFLDEYHCNDPLPWACAAQHWADSMQWPLSADPDDDKVMMKIVQNMRRSAAIPAEAHSRVHHAAAAISIMRERISRMCRRTGIDLHEQLRFIAAYQDVSRPSTEPFPFLNAKLYCPNASDLLVLFNEIILSESDFFDTDKENPLIIDGGTNIGTSLAYFKWLYPNSRIIAFEPNPHLYRICLDNIELNQWPHVTLLPYALAEQRGTATFHCDEVMPMASTLTTRPEEEGRNFTSVEVETRALHEFITGVVDFLKLDIEGAECEVLCSTRKHLRQVKAGLIEYHHGSPRNSLPRILDILEQAGMRYVINEPFHIRHDTSIKTNTPRWSRSIYFGEQ